MGDTIPILDYGELLAHTLWLLALTCAVIRLVQWVECRLDAENHALWRASLDELADTSTHKGITR